MKTIIEMAKQCGLLDGLSVVPSQVERFAELIRADEREARLAIAWNEDFQEAIRARGNA